MANKIIEELKKQIEIKNEISKKMMENIELLCEKSSQLKIEDFEDLSYKEILYIYENIHFLSSFKSIKKDVEELIAKKKLALYPKINKAIYYPILNSLEDKIPMEIIKKIDNNLKRMKVGEFIMSNSNLWRPFKEYLDLLVSLGIVKKIYELTDSSYDECFGIDRKFISEEDLLLHKKVWNMFEEIKNINDKEIKTILYEEIDKLEVDGYGYISVGDVDITKLSDFEKINKTILYKLIMNSVE